MFFQSPATSVAVDPVVAFPVTVAVCKLTPSLNSGTDAQLAFVVAEASMVAVAVASVIVHRAHPWLPVNGATISTASGQICLEGAKAGKEE
ncbi:hypothetical protein [Noviherbaspirillum galbum]|uniref:Uncharacterized protein n=1 Tax=Noviherbaspirillum galbum TaxID=2709383 RepID=A0A6B3SGN8_9BURK|nr:hypothetical protein [Noviherbaspirillum galbum]NEX60034.1 hypothetical protein [Noviherbaspirillum galbum]